MPAKVPCNQTRLMIIAATDASTNDEGNLFSSIEIIGHNRVHTSDTYQRCNHCGDEADGRFTYARHAILPYTLHAPRWTLTEYSMFTQIL